MIRQAIIQINKEIKDLEKERFVLQSQCKHKKTFKGIYSYRVGVNQEAEICSDCNKLIKYL